MGSLETRGEGFRGEGAESLIQPGYPSGSGASPPPPLPSFHQEEARAVPVAGGGTELGGARRRWNGDRLCSRAPLRSSVPSRNLLKTGGGTVERWNSEFSLNPIERRERVRETVYTLYTGSLVTHPYYTHFSFLLFLLFYCSKG